MDAGLGVRITLHTHSFTRTFPSARIGLGALPAHGQSPEVPHAAVAFDTLQTLQVHADLTAKITGNVMETYFDKADSIHVSDGNLFKALEYGTSVHGGWRLQPTEGQRRLRTTLLLGALAVGLLYLRKKIV